MDDRRWLELACDLARLCPPSDTAFSVGAVIVGADGREIARGHSREADPHAHAEESALAKVTTGREPPDPGAAALLRAPGTTVYSSLEPCGQRMSRRLTCTDLIIAAGISRVVFAWREPSVFVEGKGVELLGAMGVEVVQIPDLADRAREPNAHLLG
ncbi:dCMP deaminase [Actinomadura sp. HBU206391]|uniref:dCMP deaminase n=1 Tax=Actinomadura sp. HBU206391 TaxID=2731692 RepID=UPI00164F8B2F|nr:dCMP deaminase [Actinomadura sp. HBU206391]MBC6460460.1 dCMP deaminase [Actinomadura sp. HBU206391]